MPDDSTEVLIAIGRIEEGMRYMRESMERVEKKLDTHDNRLTDVEHEITTLKTQRDNKQNNIALWLAIIAIAVAVISNFLP
jgi:septal ring factor EnvC (AmiA/AmiB activator)